MDSLIPFVLRLCDLANFVLQLMQQDAVRLLDLDGVRSLKVGSTPTTVVFEKQGPTAVMRFKPTESQFGGWRINTTRTPAIVRTTYNTVTINGWRFTSLY